MPKKLPLLNAELCCMAALQFFDALLTAWHEQRHVDLLDPLDSVEI